MSATVVRVLLVEDDRWFADAIIKGLDVDADYRVDHVSTAQEASDSLSQKIYDVILLDMMLPGAGGLQLLHDIASYESPPPVIVCSSLLSSLPPADILQAYGVSMSLDKASLTPPRLRTAIASVIAQAAR